MKTRWMAVSLVVVLGLTSLCGEAATIPTATMTKKPTAKKPAPKPPAKKPAPKPVPNKGAGAQQIRAIEGPLLATTFNNGHFQVKFSNLRRLLAWNENGPGEGYRYIVVDYDAANLAKENRNFQMTGRAANDKGEQLDEEPGTDIIDMLPASHQKGSLAFHVPDDFTPTKFIFRFDYEGGDPLRTFLPADHKWQPLPNIGKAGTAVDNGLVSIIAAIDITDSLPSDWEAGEGNKFFVIGGTVASLFSKGADVVFMNVMLISTDGQEFQPYSWIKGEAGRLGVKGSRPFRVGFEVPSDVVPAELVVNFDYHNGIPIRIALQ